LRKFGGIENMDRKEETRIVKDALAKAGWNTKEEL